MLSETRFASTVTHQQLWSLTALAVKASEKLTGEKKFQEVGLQVRAKVYNIIKRGNMGLPQKARGRQGRRMAVNYSVKELLEVLRSDDMDAVGDALRRYSHISVALVKADAIAPGVVDLLVKMIPDYVNARKCNKTLMESFEEDAADDSKPAAKVGGSSKPEPASDVDGDDDFDDDGDNEVAADDYSSMKAMDLFKLCKERGIEAEPKHRTKYYIELLKKADSEAKPTSDVDDDDDDDWDI